MIYYLAVWVALLLGGAFFVMHSRFRLPPIYVLMPFAAYGLVRFGALWSRPTHWTKRLIGCGVLAGMGVFSNTNLFGYSNSVHTELQLTYAQACLETNRMDLLPEATRSFERAYWTEMAAGGLPWARTLQRQNPMTRLFECYDRLGDTDKALKYGRLMLDREPFVPANFRKFWKVFKKSSDEGEARRGLDVLERKALTAAPGAVIDCHRWFYDRFGDHSVLLRTEQLILRCMNQKPGDDYFITALKQVREQIDALGLRSSPASATSRSSKPGTGPERHAQ